MINVKRSLLLALFALSSQDAATAEIFDLTLEELMNMPVTVAIGSVQPLYRTPASVSLFTREQLDQYGLETLDEVLDLVPGMSISRGDSEGITFAPVVRGRNSNSVGREILVLYDGMRLNEVVTGGVCSQEKQIPLHNIQQVEIIRGPGSARYGANAYSAVINLISISDQNQAAASLGEYQHGSASLLASFNPAYGTHEFALYHTQDNGQQYEPFFNFQGQVAATQDPMERSDLYWKSQIGALSARLRWNQQTYSDFINSGAQALEYQRHITENTSLSLEYLQTMEGLDVTYFVQHANNVHDNVLGLFPEDPNPDPTGSPLYWSNGSTQLMVGGNIRTVRHSRIGANLQWWPMDKHLINAGFTAKQESNSLNPFQSNIDIDHLQATGELIPTASPGELQEGFYLGGNRADLLNSEERTSYGVYTQDIWSITDDLEITSGIRVDHYDDFGNHSSLRGAATFHKNKHTLKLTYGEAFRAPSFLETRAGIASGGIANPDLKAEVVKTTELSWYRTSRRWNVGLTYYYNHYDDYIQPVLVSDVVPGFTALQPQNIGNQYNHGYEFELSWNRSEIGEWKLTYSRSLSQIEQEAAPQTLLNLVWNQSLGNLHLHIRSHYRGKVLSRTSAQNNDNGDLYLDSYYTVHAQVQYHWGKHSAGVKIKNLLDEDYTTWSPQQGLENGIPNRGRQLFTEYQYEF